jgi:O-antigen/teichoic acid export membrane protein
MTDAKLTKKIKKGAAVNFIGMISKIIGGPVLFILLTRLYGDSSMGLFLVAYNLIEILGGLTTSGFVDGIIMFSSRHIHKEEDRDIFYSYLRKILIIAATTGLAISILLFFGAPFLNKVYYSDHPTLVPLLQIMAFVLFFEGLTRLLVAIPKAKLLMGIEVIIVGGIAPLSTIGFAVLFYFSGMGPKGIAIAFAATFAITLIMALIALARIIDLKPLLKGSYKKVKTPGIISFVIPQNLNMALNRFVSSMDVLMLAGFGLAPAKIAFYALGAQIVRNVRQVKLIFSGSYAPVIARHFHEGKVEELNRLFSMVIGWIISLGVPVLFFVAFFRHDLLLLFNSNFTTSPDFMLILLVNPFLSCATGLTGNAIVMSGFSRWNLINSLSVGSLNFALNLILIPRWGFYGAAIATAIAGTIVSTMQIIEARVLVGIKLPIKAILPWITIGLILFLWSFFFIPNNTSFIYRAALASTLLTIYLLIYKFGKERIFALANGRPPQ